MLIIIFGLKIGRKHIVKAGFSVINILVYQTECVCVFLQEWVTLFSEAEWLIKNLKRIGDQFKLSTRIVIRIIYIKTC